MKARIAGVALAAVVLAGCGSAGGGSAADPAGLVPQDALAYVTVDTDLGSGQLKSAQSVLDKFPFKDSVLQAIRSSIASGGVNVRAVKSSIGPEVDVAAVSADSNVGAVGFTQPKDEKAFDAQLDAHKLIHTTMSGWTVFSDKQAYIDAVKSRKSNLSDDEAYKTAGQTIPSSGDAIVRVYAAPLGIRAAMKAATARAAGAGATAGQAFDSFSGAKWVAAALTSASGGLKFELHASTSQIGGALGTDLAGQIPSGSIVALSLTNGGTTFPSSAQQQLGSISKSLGFDLQALVGVLDGPLIAYVRAGLPVPEVTLASRPKDPARVQKAIGQLIRKFARTGVTPVPTAVDGGTLNKVDLGSVALYYGVNGDELVVTDSANALAELKGSVGHLVDDSIFKDAKAAGGMPDGEQGFLFLNVKDALPAVSGFAQLANQTIPAGLEADLKPLRSLLVYGSREGNVQTVVAALKTND
ncbi:MAG TPA: hypothetical protein VI408_01655 [Gaiellaceae bacterium]